MVRNKFRFSFVSWNDSKRNFACFLFFSETGKIPTKRSASSCFVSDYKVSSSIGKKNIYYEYYKGGFLSS